jgi:hypothetical protein
MRILLFLALTSCQLSQESEKISKITSMDGLIALWDFSENPGEPRKARGVGAFPLIEMNRPVERAVEGPLSGFSAYLKDSAYFSIPHHDTGLLNIHGKNTGVTVLGWVNWEGKTGFVGGMWNEYTDGGKRQYGLFVHLPHYNGAEQVCGHISWTGKPTPPFPYSADYSASKQTLTRGTWHFVAFTYEGSEIRSYLDGVFEAREPELIRNTTGFEGLPDGIIASKNPYYFPDGMGDNGSDFTVGAVVLKRGLGNFFEGKIGGLAVFDRALSPDEILEIHRLTMTQERMNKNQ